MIRGNTKFLQLLLLAVLFMNIAPARLLADDAGKDHPSDATKSAKPDAPQPGLTERERLLLDRVEQLEKRVAELESKNQPSATPAEALKTTSERSTAVASANAAGDSMAVGIATNSVKPPVSPQGAEQSKPADAKQKKADPFAFADFTWMNGNPRTKEAAFDSKFFTPEIRADVEYTYDFNHPKDDTIGGSSEIFRSNEVGITQLGVGGDFHYDHVHARLMTQFGMYSETTPRNDASYSRGQWNLA